MLTEMSKMSVLGDQQKFDVSVVPIKELWLRSQIDSNFEQTYIDNRPRSNPNRETSFS